MQVVPEVGVLAAHAGQVGPGALAAPLEGMVEQRFLQPRVLAVAQHLVAEGPDHLAVAGVAALGDVDVAARQLQGAVGLLDPLGLLGQLRVRRRSSVGDLLVGTWAGCSITTVGMISTAPPTRMATSTSTVNTKALRSIRPYQ